MRAAAERAADVLRQHADIGAFAAGNAQHRVGRGPFDKGQRMNRDGPRRARNLDAFARVFVIITAAILERGMAWRDLRDGAAQRGKRAQDLVAREIGAAALRLDAFGVAGRRRCAETHGRDIFLVGIEQRLRELGRVAETNGEEPRSGRIERSRMPRLLGRVEPPRPLQRRVGRKAWTACREPGRRRRGGAARAQGEPRRRLTAKARSGRARRQSERGSDLRGANRERRATMTACGRRKPRRRSAATSACRPRSSRHS